MLIVLRKQLERTALERGVPVFGVAPAQPWEARPGHSPTEILSSAKTVVVLGAPIPRTPEIEMPFRNAHKTETLRSQMLNTVTYFITQELEDAGYKAVLIPTSDFADSKEKLTIDPTYHEIMTGDIAIRYAAVKAGLAVIGKSGMALHPRYGAFIGFSLVLTNADLPVDHPLDADFCGNCTTCIDTCFTGALSPEGTYDPIVCNTDLHGKLNLIGVDHPVCPAPCRINCPVGLQKDLNPGAKMHGVDPFLHMPYNTFHRIPLRQNRSSRIYSNSKQ